jgi:uncharacterized membrane protein
MATEATRVIGLDDIKFKEENKVLAAASCIPLVGLIVFFVERNDLFVRYFAAQYGILGVVLFLLGFLSAVPVLGLVMLCVLPLLWLGSFILVVLGAMKAYKGERYDVPVVSGWALQLMNKY